MKNVNWKTVEKLTDDEIQDLATSDNRIDLEAYLTMILYRNVSKEIAKAVKKKIYGRKLKIKHGRRLKRRGT